MGWREGIQLDKMENNKDWEEKIDCLFPENDMKGDPKYAYLLFLEKEKKTHEMKIIIGILQENLPEI